MYLFQGQYEFVYDAVLDAMKCGVSVIPTEIFRDKYKEMNGAKDQGKSGLEKQFQVNG